MRIYLISNNLLLENINYNNSSNLNIIRMTRPLSNKGETIAKSICNKDIFNDIEKIYSSFYSSALSTAKYLSEKLELEINMSEELNECQVGVLSNKNMKMVKGLQDHEFTYKLPNGESLNDVGNRIDRFVKQIINSDKDSIIFTHKRAILGYLLKYSKVGYNLDDNLIVEYNGKIVYDDSETELDIYELLIDKNEIIDIKKL